MGETWTVTYIVHRKKGQNPSYFDQFTLEVTPDEYVLDGVERIWAFHDRTLTFRHACHHATCGACGMRVNGVEKLTCATHIHEVTSNEGTIKIEPLRNFPVISDLVVDIGTLYARMESVGARVILPLSEAPTIPGIARDKTVVQTGGADYLRLNDCIECGLCISACPIASTDAGYLGPAVLAAVQQQGPENASSLFNLAESTHGVWRCHSAYECTAVCPSFVEPGWRIMDLRKQVIVQRLKQLFRSQ